MKQSLSIHRFFLHQGNVIIDFQRSFLEYYLKLATVPAANITRSPPNISTYHLLLTADMKKRTPVLHACVV